MANSVTIIPDNSFFYLSTALSLSAIAGIAAFFVPAGLGVRESIITAILSAVLPVSHAVIISVLFRIVTTTAELFIIAFTSLIISNDKAVTLR